MVAAARRNAPSVDAQDSAALSAINVAIAEGMDQLFRKGDRDSNRSLLIPMEQRDADRVAWYFVGSIPETYDRLGSEPLLRCEILDDHSQASPFGPKSDGPPRLNSVILNFFLTPQRERDGQNTGPATEAARLRRHRHTANTQLRDRPEGLRDQGPRQTRFGLPYRTPVKRSRLVAIPYYHRGRERLQSTCRCLLVRS